MRTAPDLSGRAFERLERGREFISSAQANHSFLASNHAQGYPLTMNRPFDFSGKIVLVTGSSRGIGAGIITAFGQCGARCIVNYVADPDGRNLADAQRVAGSIKESLLLQCDVGDADQVHAMMAQIQTEAGGLDILVNNAGILRDRTL